MNVVKNIELHQNFLIAESAEKSNQGSFSEESMNNLSVDSTNPLTKKKRTVTFAQELNPEGLGCRLETIIPPIKIEDVESENVYNDHPMRKWMILILKIFFILLAVAFFVGTCIIIALHNSNNIQSII